MLRDIKQQSSGLGAKIVMGLIIVSFVFFGISGSLLTSNNDSAATVNGEKVTIAKFNQANQSQKDRMKQQFGDNLGSEYFDTENFKRGVLNQLVDSELLKQEAAKFDYDVSPSRVREYIESSPGLQIDGNFSNEAYANFLAQVNKSAELLERDIKGDLKGSAIPLMISQTSFALDSEVESQYKISKQKRSFNYLELNSKDYEKEVEVAEEEINNHFKEFGSDYMTKELVSVNYLELSTADLLKDIVIEETDLQEYYDGKKATLMTAEKRKTQHILLPVSDNADEVKSEIEKVAARIAAGEDFTEVAKEVSQDPGSAPQGGDLGMVSQGDMVEAFDAKLFSMKAGEISEPVLSKFGYHIIKLNEIKSPEVPSLADIRGKLTEELKKDKAEELFLTQADELDTMIIDSDNLEIAAESSGLELKTTELFARGLRGTSVAANPEFLKVAFSDAIKKDNEISAMIDLGENHIAYLHIKEHKLPESKLLADVSEAIKAKLTSEKSLALVKTKVEDYIAKIKSGETNLADIATSLKKEVVEAKDIERTGSKQPYQLVQNIFKLKIDVVAEVTSVESSANSFALVLINSVIDADLSTIKEADKTSISTQIQRMAANTEMQNLTSELKINASITINEKIFEVQQ